MSYPSFVVNRHHPADALGGDEETEPSCCICTAALALGNRIRRLRCGHCFHVACGDTYLTTQQAVCPVDGLTVDANGRAPDGPQVHGGLGRRRRRQRRRNNQGEDTAAAQPPTQPAAAAASLSLT